MATHRKPCEDHDFSTSAKSGSTEDGQTMAEYAVVLGVLVVGCIAAFPALNSVIGGMFTLVADAIKGA